MGRWLSKEEREKRDARVAELYRQGVSPQSIFLRFGRVDIYSIIRKYGIEPKQRTVLSREEREKRDREIIKLYQSGLTYRAITQKLRLCGDSVVTAALKRHHIPLRGRLE